jgi:hypothetical protein
LFVTMPRVSQQRSSLPDPLPRPAAKSIKQQLKEAIEERNNAQRKLEVVASFMRASAECPICNEFGATHQCGACKQFLCGPCVGKVASCPLCRDAGIRNAIFDPARAATLTTLFGVACDTCDITVLPAEKGRHDYRCKPVPCPQARFCDQICTASEHERCPFVLIAKETAAPYEREIQRLQERNEFLAAELEHARIGAVALEEAETVSLPDLDMELPASPSYDPASPSFSPTSPTYSPQVGYRPESPIYVDSQRMEEE